MDKGRAVSVKLFLQVGLAFLCTCATPLPASALAEKTRQFDVAQVDYNAQSGPLSNESSVSRTVFREKIRFPGADWIRLELSDVLLNNGDYIRIVPLATGAEQTITNTDPQYGDTITSVIFPGDSVDVELTLAPRSTDAMLTITTVLAAYKLPNPETICGAKDDRTLFTDACAVRIVDSIGGWGSGFMISNNWMITAAHVMTDGPWTVQANVEPSKDPGGAIQPPREVARDQFTVKDLTGSALGTPLALGDDWAVVNVPNNANRAPGAACTPTFNCAYVNTTDGANLKVDGFGVSDQAARNGVLQTHTGPSVAGGNNANHFRHRADTRANNSGSRVTDDKGRIIGIHTHGDCKGSDPETGANSGTLIKNADLVAAVKKLSGADICATPEKEKVGTATAACDFDGDGFADLAIGVPGEDVGTIIAAGVVNVLYGTASGLSTTGRQTFDQNKLALSGGTETGDRFGSALAAGDFDGDGFCDLAISVPDEDVGTIVDAGVVNVLYGSSHGLSSMQVWDQNKPFIEGAAEAGDHFGAALAAGDFDGDGFADLAIGVPGEDVGAITDAGVVNVLYGTRSRLSASHDQLWDQNRIGGSTSEAGDHFGAALGAGDFNGDGFTDLAIGAPNEGVGKAVGAGAVAILYGSRLNLSASHSQTWSQSTTGVEGISETGDEFGSALAVADFDHDGFADLAIGIPGENGDAGAVEVLYGTPNNLSAAHDQVWNQNRSGVEGTAERADRFGAAVSGGDFNGDGFADLAVGVPGESTGGANRAGAVNVLYGTALGLSAANDQEWEQGKGGVKGGPDTDDAFGAAAAAGDFNGDGFADLAIGVPGENNGAGALNVLYGTANDLSAAGNDLFQ